MKKIVLILCLLLYGCEPTGKPIDESTNITKCSLVHCARNQHNLIFCGSACGDEVFVWPAYTSEEVQ